MDNKKIELNILYLDNGFSLFCDLVPFFKNIGVIFQNNYEIEEHLKYMYFKELSFKGTVILDCECDNFSITSTNKEDIKELIKYLEKL